MDKANFEPTGFHYSNYRLDIMINESGDAVIYRWNGSVAQRWQEIKYDRKGEAYFTVYGRKYYLNDFIKYPNL